MENYLGPVLTSVNWVSIKSLYDDDDVAAVVLNKNESIHEWLGTLWLTASGLLSFASFDHVHVREVIRLDR